MNFSKHLQFPQTWYYFFFPLSWKMHIVFFILQLNDFFFPSSCLQVGLFL